MSSSSGRSGPWTRWSPPGVSSSRVRPLWAQAATRRVWLSCPIGRGCGLWIGPGGPDGIEQGGIADLDDAALSSAPITATERTAPVHPAGVAVLACRRRRTAGGVDPRGTIDGGGGEPESHRHACHRPRYADRRDGHTGHDRRTARESLAAIAADTPWCSFPVSWAGDRIGAAIARHAVTDLWTSFADLKAIDPELLGRCGI